MNKLVTLFIIFSLTLSAQVVYEPLHRDVYEYLSRLAQKGIIEYNDEIKPVSRDYIAELLITADNQKSTITSLEKQELDFYKKEYGSEIISFLLTPYELNGIVSSKDPKNVNIFAKDTYGRYRLFSYSDNLFKVNVSPIFGYERGSDDGNTNSHMWNGAYLYGYLGSRVGFSFDLRDNKETGDYDTLKNFTPVTGVNPIGFKSGMEYSEIRTHLSYSWDWGHIAIGKEFIEWGYGESGKLVLSQKAPSFPFIKYDISPIEWLQFNFIHAWLSSDIVDSNETYATGSIRGGTHRVLYREKYFASHTLTLKPFKGFSFSLGESIIYSDRFEPVYLFPLMFFRAADHYLSRQNNSAGGNSQFFISISSRNHIPNTHLYASAIIDEISYGESKAPKNQSGFTLGGSVADPGLRNLKLTIEYTRILPFVYMHYIPTQRYQNASYNMGHWMGSNADLIYAALQYKILRGLTTNLWFQAIRKGEEGDPELQHTIPQAPFLFGLRNNYLYTGAEIKYELTHELFLRARFIHHNNEFQQEDKSFIKKNFNEFYMALYYGL